MSGGELVAAALADHGVSTLFTLCGGHISPILAACHRRGIRVIDTRHEAAAVFAADAVSRLTGIPGVAAVTAGPGVTNTITAVTNARLAQSPVIVLGGATAGILKGRGALQDIDQMALMRAAVKWSAAATRVRDIPTLLTTAFRRAQEGVRGPVFVELPVDLLYDQTIVRDWFAKAGQGNRAVQWYMRRYLRRTFGGVPTTTTPLAPGTARRPGNTSLEPSDNAVAAVAKRFAAAKRPVLVVGSQAVGDPSAAPAVVAALERIGAPVFLSGMSRGLLGPDHPQHIRHQRKEALREADLVLLAGVPADFRLNYGRDIGRGAFLVAANRNAAELKKNRKPDIALHADPGSFLIQLAAAAPLPQHGDEWMDRLHGRDAERELSIEASSSPAGDHINPVALCRAIDRALGPDSIIVADGGDFVSTASYVVRPRGPLSWLDPGPFGTLGVGGGFALGAAASRPSSELWILYGDGALGFSIAEFDTFARHGVAPIAIVANDACWSQIHREQVDILGDDVGCMLERTDYHVAAEGLGACGLLLTDIADADAILQKAKQLAAGGRPVLVNAMIGRSEFRKGSISM